MAKAKRSVVEDIEVPQASLDALHGAIGAAVLAQMGIRPANGADPDADTAEDIIRDIAAPLIAAELRKIARNSPHGVDPRTLLGRAAYLHGEEVES